MRKFLGLLLALCLILAVAAEAFAAGKPEITEQPKSATTSEKGSITFAVKVNGKGSKITYTWYFVNPASGEKISGKNLKKTFKGIVVNKPNAAKITLKKVPQEMHGWLVYCHINGNGYKLDTEQVTLSVYGMEPLEEAAPAPEAPAEGSDPAASAESAPAAEDAAPDAEEASAEPASDPASEPAAEEAAPAEEEAPAEAAAPPEAPAAAESESEGDAEVSREITINASGDFLYPMDSLGKLTAEAPVSSIAFINTGNVAIHSEDAIRSWTINGIRYESEVALNTIRLFNVSQDLSVSLGLERKTAASASVDESRMCKVVCTGCSFTCISRGLRAVTEGEVPAGSLISVFCTDSSALANGYSINGADPVNAGKASFQFTVTEDTEIILR